MSLWGRIFGINKNPEYELGIKLYNEGKYELAVAELEKAIQKAGKADPFYALGMFYAAESHAHIGTAKSTPWRMCDSPPKPMSPVNMMRLPSSSIR